ncbi:MAG TPA: helix-turn-helix domain-containing protein [Solirubrobacteraceae bacterium]|nr:helix-turn-helix domain-containing protein [Solirubrobacteraceae bacterium]
MPEPAPTRALFVRIPQAHAQALDRLAFESRRPKQAVVTELLGRYIGDPPGKPASARRITIDAGPEPGTVIGRHAFRPFEPDVLTLEEVAALLSVSTEAVRELAESGELPGRRIASEWRFARAAVLDWLAGGAAQ